MFVSQFTSHIRRRSRNFYFYVSLSALAASILLVSCSNPFGGSKATPTATLSANVALAQLKWCSKPTMLFRDEGAAPSVTAPATATATSTVKATSTAAPGGSPTVTATRGAAPGTPTTVSDWAVVKANLGFTVFLPAMLPHAACLVSAQATIHDPTFGGSFLIGYLLPDHTSITISEAPLTSQNTAFQCNVSNSSSPQKGSTPTNGTPQPTISPIPTQVPLQLCSGAKNTTNIVLSARRSIEYLQQVFNALQPDITWIPAA